MKSNVRLFILALTLPLAAVALASCGKSSAEEKGGAKNVDTLSVDVKVEEIQLRDFREEIQVTGSVEAFEDVVVSAEEGGRLLQWLVPKGGHVTKGQVIAKLDDALLKGGFEAANAQYLLAEVTYSKQKKVFEEQAISEWQLKTFEYQRDAAKAQADIARARLEKTAIKSPISGVLDLRNVDEGELVGPGTPVAHIVNNAHLRVAAGVPERYAGAFRVGDPVRFTIDAFPNESFEARVTFVGAAVMKDNRSIPVEAVVKSTREKLKPDMIASMRITLAQRPNSIVIPEEYVQQVDKDRFVAYVAEGGIARERRLTIGTVSRGMMLVTDGLRAGDKLITLGHQNVAGGQKITIIEK